MAFPIFEPWCRFSSSFSGNRNLQIRKCDSDARLPALRAFSFACSLQVESSGEKFVRPRWRAKQ